MLLVLLLLVQNQLVGGKHVDSFDRVVLVLEQEFVLRVALTLEGR